MDTYAFIRQVFEEFATPTTCIIFTIYDSFETFIECLLHLVTDSSGDIRNLRFAAFLKAWASAHGRSSVVVTTHLVTIIFVVILNRRSDGHCFSRTAFTLATSWKFVVILDGLRFAFPASLSARVDVRCGSTASRSIRITQELVPTFLSRSLRQFLKVLPVLESLHNRK